MGRQKLERAREVVEAAEADSEIKIRAERRAGEILVETVQHQGGRPEKQSHRATVLPDGITKSQSSRWQKMAEDLSLADLGSRQHLEPSE